MLPAGRLKRLPGMNKLKLTYRFALPDSRERVFDLQLDHDTAELAPLTDPNPPAWTELGFHQCIGCPLDAAKVGHCYMEIGRASCRERV